MFKLWPPTMILVIKFTKDSLRSIHPSILIQKFTRLSCNMKTPINLEGVKERTSEEEEVEAVEIKEEEDSEAGTTKETIMAALVIKINIITMILININNESLYTINQLKYIL